MKTTRRSLRLLASVVLALAACATTAQYDAARFSSDRISVVTRGSGPDIILVHGLGGNRDLWNDAAATLDDRYRLHMVQINGFGMPPFMGAAFGNPSGTAADLRPVAEQIHTEFLTVTFDSTMFARMIPAMTLVDSMRPILLQSVRASDRRMVANAFHEIIVTDLRPELARINVPMSVLYVVPSDVPLTPDQFDASMKELFRNAPHARLVRIDNARHFLQYDQPARFIAEVDAFVR